MAIIISASRRTDILSFYLPWFKQRVKEEFCTVKNPFNPKIEYKISLSPNDVDGIVFWTRNPLPLLKDKKVFKGESSFLKYLIKRYKFYILFTITGYSKEIEPVSIPLDKAIETFIEASETLTEGFGLTSKDEKAVIWRYDPIIITPLTDIKFHRENFSYIAQKLKGYTSRVIVSYYDPYKRAEQRLLQAGIPPVKLEELEKTPAFIDLLKFIKKTASQNAISIQSCCNTWDKFGIPQGACIDANLFKSLFNITIIPKKDPHQRKKCLCNISKDIGKYNTCLFKCLYCYANKNFKKAQEYYTNHIKNNTCL